MWLNVITVIVIIFVNVIKLTIVTKSHLMVIRKKILCVSQTFASIIFVDDCGTKKTPSEQLVSMTAAKLKAH